MIGLGPASVSAAEAVRSQDRPAAISSIIGAEPHGYYSRPGLAYYLADEVPERQLFPFRPDDFTRLGMRVILKPAAQNRSARPYSRLLEDHEVIPYDRLLIATGSRAIPIDVPGADLEGVVKLDDLEDARQLIRQSRRAKAAVVVGGGITALEIVEGLHARRVHVHYLMRKDRYWSDVLSESESRIVEQGLQVLGVHIHRQAELARVLGLRGHVVGVETALGETIPCDMLAGSGRRSAAQGIGRRSGPAVCARRCGQRVFCSPATRTSLPPAMWPRYCEPVANRFTLEILWSSAVAKGRVAGLNMSGSPAHADDERGTSERDSSGWPEGQHHGHGGWWPRPRYAQHCPRRQRNMAALRATLPRLSGKREMLISVSWRWEEPTFWVRWSWETRRCPSLSSNWSRPALMWVPFESDFFRRILRGAI